MANVVSRGGVGVLLWREGSVVVGRRRSLRGHESFAFPGGHGVFLSFSFSLSHIVYTLLPVKRETDQNTTIAKLSLALSFSPAPFAA